MNNSGIKNGLLYGAFTVGLYLVGYIINKKLLFSLGFGPIISIVIPVVFMIVAARSTRAKQEGVMSFGEALSSTFLTYIIGSLIFAVFSFTMSNIIDPSLLDIQQEVTLETLDKMSGMLGGNDDQIEMMKEGIEDGVDIGFGSVMMGWAFSLILPGFIIAAIISAIMKRSATA